MYAVRNALAAFVARASGLSRAEAALADAVERDPPLLPHATPRRLNTAQAKRTVQRLTRRVG
jgi:hypothetical protein